MRPEEEPEEHAIEKGLLTTERVEEEGIDRTTVIENCPEDRSRRQEPTGVQEWRSKWIRSRFSDRSEDRDSSTEDRRSNAEDRKDAGHCRTPEPRIRLAERRLTARIKIQQKTMGTPLEKKIGALVNTVCQVIADP